MCKMCVPYWLAKEGRPVVAALHSFLLLRINSLIFLDILSYSFIFLYILSYSFIFLYILSYSFTFFRIPLYSLILLHIPLYSFTFLHDYLRVLVLPVLSVRCSIHLNCRPTAPYIHYVQLYLNKRILTYTSSTEVSDTRHTPFESIHTGKNHRYTHYTYVIHT
jgi:hypothetical protein